MLALRLLLLGACVAATTHLVPLATEAVREERGAFVLAPTSVPIDPPLASPPAAPTAPAHPPAAGAPARSALALLPLILPLPLPLALALPPEPREALASAGGANPPPREAPGAPPAEPGAGVGGRPASQGGVHLRRSEP